MKIIIPVIGFGRAGGERVLSKMATELMGDENEVIFVKPKNGTFPYYPTNASIIESPFHCNGFKIFDYAKNLIELIRVCRQLEPDVVIASYFITAYLAMFLSPKKSKYYYIQANEFKINKNIVFKILALLSYVLPLKKIVNSKHLLPKFLNDYIAIIPAGVDLSLYKNVRKKRDSSRLKVGFVGRKEKYKGSDEIVGVLASLDYTLRSKIEVHVALYLSEENKEKLSEYFFHKIDSDSDLALFYSQCDIVIATGLIENGAFHYPCAEAMASGCLVISNYAPLENSILQIESFSAEGVANKLRYCLDEMSEEDIESEVLKNTQTIEAYSWESIGAKFRATISADR